MVRCNISVVICDLLLTIFTKWFCGRNLYFFFFLVESALLDNSITCLVEDFEGDGDLEVSPVSLCPLPLAGTAWGGGTVLKPPGTFPSNSMRHLRQLALFLPCSRLPPSAGDIWAAWLLPSSPAAALTPCCQPLAQSSTLWLTSPCPLLGHRCYDN